MEIFDLDLGPFGAPGFSMSERVDFTGHQFGSTDPHLNTDLINPQGDILYRHDPADFRDLTHTQLPGFNGMQH